MHLMRQHMLSKLLFPMNIDCRPSLYVLCIVLSGQLKLSVLGQFIFFSPDQQVLAMGQNTKFSSEKLLVENYLNQTKFFVVLVWNVNLDI